jgi:hypothetical protein
MVESETLPNQIKSRRKKMTKTINRQAVAVKTRVNAGALDGSVMTAGAKQGFMNHNETVALKTRGNAGTSWARAVGDALKLTRHETVAVKTRVNAGCDAASGLPSGK